MGLFFTHYVNPNGKLKSINEVEMDGQEQTGDEAIDYTDDGAQPQNEPAPEGNQQPEQPQDNPPPEEGGEPPADEGTTDYTEGGPEDMPQEGMGDNQGGTPPPDEEAPVEELKAKEEELLSKLTPEQLDIMHKELKTKYLDMFDTVNAIIDRIGDAGIDEDSITVIEYVSTELSTLKNMIADYVESVYKTKSYIENSVNYNRFLAVLHGIQKILEEIDKNIE